MAKADNEALADLHGELARVLKNIIMSDERTASDLSGARQFLKDTSITADLAASKELQALTDNMPEDLDDGTVVPIYGRS